MKSSAHTGNGRQVPTLTSQVIDLMRFPLIVGVVFIHAIFDKSLLPAAGEVSMPVYHTLVNLLSRYIPEVAVPMFFLFAGYLFFFKVDTMTSAVYLDRLKSRARSLLVPYLFWNILLWIAIMALDSYVDIHTAGKNVAFPVNLWGAISGDDGIRYPLAGQFWFIRDLMVCVVISPLLWFLICHTRHFGVLLLAAAWFAGWEIPIVGPLGMSMTALFFFSLGGWCARHRADMAATATDIRIFGALWPLLVISQLFLPLGPLKSILWHLMVLSGIVFCMSVAAWLVSRRGVKAVPLLTASSFFIFAYHAQWGQSPIRRLMFAIVRPDSDLSYSAVYLLHTLLAIAAGVLIYKLLSHYLPKFTSLITGGR